MTIVFPFFANISPAEQEAQLTLFRQGQDIPYHATKRKQKDGSTFWVKTKGIPFFDNEQEIICYTGHSNTLGKVIAGCRLQGVEGGKEVEPGSIEYRDDKGYYFLCGRTDDLIISAGNNTYPMEIEVVLTSHPNVEDVVVIGVEDVYSGQILKAFVQLCQDKKMTEEALLSRLGTRVAEFQIPREIAFVEGCLIHRLENWTENEFKQLQVTQGRKLKSGM